MPRKLSFWSKASEYIKKNWFWLVAIGLVSVSLVINYNTTAKELDAAGDEKATIYKIGYVVVAAVFGLIVFALLKLAKKRENNYPKIFAIFATVLGVVFLGLSPLFTGSDEHNHYYRIYEITEGTVQTPVTETDLGSRLPKSLSKTFEIGTGDNTQIKYKYLPEMWGVALDGDDNVVYGLDKYTTYYANTALYAPVSYVPHVVGFALGKTVGAGPYMIGMLGRLCNLIFYIVIGYLAIKIMPKGKLFYLLILLSPVMMQCATTLSADAWMCGIFLLFLAIIMKVRLGKGTITRWQEVAIAGLGVLLALSKICYMPLVALVFLIRKDQYRGGAREKYLFAGLVLVVAAVCSGVWMLDTGAVFDVAYPQADLQKAYIMAQPLDYIIVLLRSIAITLVDSIECLFVGTKMYHSQVVIPAVISLIYVAIVVLAMMRKEGKNDDNLLNRFERGAIISVGVVVAVLILTALYVQCTAQFTAVANPTIVGIQGRYFIPIVFCLPFVVSWKKRMVVDEKKLIAVSLMITMVVWFHMLSQFII